MRTIYGFVDGGYLNVVANQFGVGGFADPCEVVRTACGTDAVQSIFGGDAFDRTAIVRRATFYDAMPDTQPESSTEQAKQEKRQAYWDAVEQLDDMHLGFGVARRGRRGLKQKGVDTLIAVDMLVGAFTEIYDIAVLVAGDADFVPVVDEVRRRGASVVIVADREKSLSPDLRRAADRCVPLLSWEEYERSREGALVSQLR